MVHWIRTLGESSGWFANLVQIAGAPGLVYAIATFLRARADYRRRRQLLSMQAPAGTAAVDYHRPGVLEPGDAMAVVRAIRDALQQATVSVPVRKALLFYAGPLSVALAIGALVDNWVPVDVYQFNAKHRQYEFMYTLDLETVKGI